MTSSTILRPNGPALPLLPGHGVVVGSPPQLGDQSDATYWTVTADMSGSTVAECTVEPLPDSTIGRTIVGIHSYFRVSLNAGLSTDLSGDAFLSIGRLSTPPEPTFEGVGGWLQSAPVLGQVYELGPSILPPDAWPILETILRSDDPWIRVRPAGILFDPGASMTIYDLWIEVMFQDLEIAPLRLYPRRRGGITTGRLWPPDRVTR